MTAPRARIDEPFDAALTTRRWLIGAVVAVSIAGLVGMLALWPTGAAPDLGAQPTSYVDGTVASIRETICEDIELVASTGCRIVTVEIDGRTGTDATGEYVIRDTDFETPDVDVGDAVTLLDIRINPEPFRYTFVDFQRATTLWWFLALFVVIVVIFGRWQGVRALLGLVLSGVVILAFIIPSLLRDEPAVLVALSGTVVIAVIALVLAHGANMSTVVALAGTLASLAITTGLAVLAANFAHLSGLAGEEAQVLRVTADALDLRGLLIAGIVLGALGVLDDVTVTQVSTVGALRRADPTMGNVTLYREAVAVGRDHVASTVNTLVLAYAGAALPLLLVFAEGTRPIGRILSSEIVAVEVIRMLVGSIGLVLSVPITTALAAIVLTGSEPSLHGHGHGHGHDEGPGHGHDEGPGHGHDEGHDEGLDHGERANWHNGGGV